MSNIAEIDKNFKIETNIEREGLTFHKITDEPFRVHGLIREDGRWVRLPLAVAKTVSDGVASLAPHTAGGRVRFVTDSPYIVIKAEVPGAFRMNHMPNTGMAGFDLYAEIDGEERYIKTFIPPVDINDSYDAVIDTGFTKAYTVTVNFPLYCPVKDLFIGLKAGCVLDRAPDYEINVPIVYYGNSVTQGGCASRPGNSYQAMISRRYNADYLNLGFSGNGKGEDAIVDYMADLEMSAFVCDYDHNAPNPDYLRATHKKLVDAIRKKHPEIPIVLMSRPKPLLSAEEERRFEVIRDTYAAAVAAGDKNIYLIRGTELADICGFDGTVDGCHPNDLGFFSMFVRLAEEMDNFF